VVPANALASPTALSIRASAAVPLDPYAVVGSAVEVGPAGTTFAAPATLALRYTDGRPPWGIDEGELRLHVLQGGAWTPVPGGGVDADSREVSATITSAGVFGVRWTGPSANCRAAEDRQFDFWLGAWDLRPVSGGSAGPNDITRNGCVLEEHYRAAQGHVGRSVSFRSVQDGLWYQTYVDSLGNRLAMRGGLEGTTMILNYEQGGRATWTPLDVDRVRFTQEAPQGSGWRVTYDSVYLRRQASE
jgi:hypothetical protein